MDQTPGRSLEDMEADAAFMDLGLESESVRNMQPGNRELLGGIRELITLMPRPKSPISPRDPPKRRLPSPEEEPIRGIDERAQNELASCLAR